MASAQHFSTALDCPVDKEIMLTVKMEIGLDWVALAERLLPSADVDAIKHDHHLFGMKEMAYQALRKWSHRESKQATIRNLVFHLEKIGNVKLANQIREMAIGKSGLFETNSSVEVYLAIANASKEEWRPLAERLLSVEEVKTVEQICVASGRSDMLFQCLQLWRNKQQEVPSIQKLLAFFDEQGEMDKTGKILASISEVPVEPLTVVDGPLCYSMNYAKRGLAIIFNQKYFDNYPQKTRQGTEKDRDALEKTFIHLGFDKNDILKREDFTTEQIEEELKRVSRKVDHTDHACLVVAILSHGGPGYVATRNDPEMPTDVLWERFHGIHCPTLAGKPKIFLIQACQGTLKNLSLQLDSEEQVDAASFTTTIPQYYTDLLIAYSTPPGFVSVRNISDGSWFIQTLCTELTAHGHSRDLQTILTSINNEVTKRESVHGQQIPGYTSFLRKQVIFSPKRKLPN